jgi:hypothetical protein
MPSSRPCGITVLGLALGLSLACGKATGVPSDDAPSASNPQRVPFDHGSQSGTNEQFLAVSRLPEGTPIAIRLLTPLSSASSHVGDSFQGRLEDAVVVEGEIAAPRGTTVSGRVLAVKAAGQERDPGYLRIALISLTIDNKRVSIDTSSLFVKGIASKSQDRGGAGAESPSNASKSGEVEFGQERRLTFRLARAVDLP